MHSSPALHSGTRARVCVLMPMHWSRQAGGAELQVRALLGALSRRADLDVHCIVRSAGEDYSPEGYTLHRLQAPRSLAGTFLFDAPALLRLLDQVAPDVVYQRVGCVYTGISAWWARRRGRRMVWHVASDRDLAPQAWRMSLRAPVEQLDRWIVAFGARKASSIIVQNAAQAELLRTRFGRHDAVRIPNFHPIPPALATKPADRVTIAWVGNIKPIKRPEMFVRLASDLRDLGQVDFVMAGAQNLYGREWDDLRERIAHLPNLHYLGPRPHDEINALLDRSHLLVNTSRMEGFPNTFIQAWMRAVPAVSLSVDPDGVFQGEKMGICADDDYERMALAVRRLATDRRGREAMGARAAAIARSDYSDANLERVIDLLISGPLRAAAR
jgi:glycosyltransferase involved in cell wall biosynthesis